MLTSRRVTGVAIGGSVYVQNMKTLNIQGVATQKGKSLKMDKNVFGGEMIWTSARTKIFSTMKSP